MAVTKSETRFSMRWLEKEILHLFGLQFFNFWQTDGSEMFGRISQRSLTNTVKSPTKEGFIFVSTPRGPYKPACHPKVSTKCSVQNHLAAGSSILLKSPHCPSSPLSAFVSLSCAQRCTHRLPSKKRRICLQKDHLFFLIPGCICSLQRNSIYISQHWISSSPRSWTTFWLVMIKFAFDISLLFILKTMDHVSFHQVPYNQTIFCVYASGLDLSFSVIPPFSGYHQVLLVFSPRMHLSFMFIQRSFVLFKGGFESWPERRKWETAEHSSWVLPPIAQDALCMDEGSLNKTNKGIISSLLPRWRHCLP